MMATGLWIAWRRGFVAVAALLASIVFVLPAKAKMSVLSSPHNLSASGGLGGTRPGVTFSDEKRVCVFCHVPHHSTPGAPLWSRPLPPEGTEYRLYQSSTLSAVAVTGKPTGASRLCLSCHDGTIALGQFVGSGITSDVKMPAGVTDNPNLTINLQDDHPISVEYTEAVAQKSQLVPPSGLGGAVRLEGGRVLQCTSCHDPHDNQYGNFLVMNDKSLCGACHRPAGWDDSVHSPLRTPTLTNGCATCHVPHSAPTPLRLLRGAKPDDTCYASCHNGIGAGPNIKALLGLNPGHPVGGVKGENVHDELESLPVVNYHVQCVDCHNPHQVTHETAPLSRPPLVNGRLKGIRRNDLGEIANYEYEVCFKCHSGGNAGKFVGIPAPNRMIPEPNQALRFDILNPSFHPVAADRKSSGASLLTELQTMARIYCSDCHNNNLGTKAGGSGPNGPHGSQYQHILIAQYDMPVAGATTPTYDKGLYALCFRCHSEEYVMGAGSAFSNAGGNQHASHVRDRQIPCFACHDPHGVPWQLGATAANNAHLINFEKGYAAGSRIANPLYTSTVPGEGSCAVNCHSSGDGTRSYSRSAAKGLLLKPTQPNRLR